MMLITPVLVGEEKVSPLPLKVVVLSNEFCSIPIFPFNSSVPTWQASMLFFPGPIYCVEVV